MGVQELVGSKTGLKVRPLIEDMKEGELRGTLISSMDIRKGISKFLRTCQGFNNRIPKKLAEASEDIKRNPSPAEPEWIWPEPHVEEVNVPLEETGRLNICIDSYIVT